MRTLFRIVALSLLAVCAASSRSAAAQSTEAQLAGLRSKINHVIVIYQENWSFDGLYGSFPGANGTKGRGTPQLQCPSGGTSYAPLTGNPPALIVAGKPTGPWPCGWQGLSGGAQDPFVPIGLPVKPYDLRLYDPTDVLTGDLWHIFWHQQLQIDNGVLEPSAGTPMDKFVAYSSNPGLVFSYYNVTHMPEGVIAQHYTLMDNFFHSAFGGSFLNHQWLICACTPLFNQPLPASPAFVSAWNPATHTLNDANVTTMPRPGMQGPLYIVNTSFSANSPHPASVPRDQLIAPFPPTQKTIGDLLTDHQPEISWKWYSGDWNLILANDPRATTCSFATSANPRPARLNADCFQYHHQAFAYYQRWGTDGSPAKAAHLQDEENFLADLKGGSLPAVAFIKPVGVNNEHPAYSDLLRGQQHVRDLVEAVCESSYWKDSAIIITYDENGGRWDHVAPPRIDQWGPGTRVPAIVVSPYARAHHVDHTQSETVSILTLIEKRFGLQPLGTRDAHASPLLSAFDFAQPPLACKSS